MSITVAASPPVVAVSVPLVPVRADALSLLSDGRTRCVEERIRVSLPLKDLQGKTLARVEGCAKQQRQYMVPAI